MNNYFSLCIANLGVVPLFLLAFFLFLPADLAFLVLIISVFIVLDAISTTPAIIGLINFKNIYLYFSRHNVKIILLILTFYALQNSIAQTVFLAKGEQKTIKFNELSKFSIGNKEVIGHQLIKNSRNIHIKGKSIGFSDLIIWDRKGNKTTYQVFVLSKGNYLKTVQWADYLTGLRLETKIKGNMLFIAGKISEINEYQSLKRAIEKIGKENINLKVELEQNVKNQIIANVLKDFVSQGEYQIKCKANGIDIICYHSINNKELLKFYRNNYFINFIKSSNSERLKNFRVSLNIYQIEYSSSRVLHNGLHKIQTRVDEVISDGANGLIKNNMIHMEDINANISIIAKPEGTIRNGEELKLSLGADRQYTMSANQLAQNFEWKFSGLKSKIKVTQTGRKPLLHYDNEFTNNSQNEISGSKESGSFFIELKRPNQLFKIGRKEQANIQSSVPFLSAIPIIGHVFKGTQKIYQYKEIIGHITVEEI